MNILKNIKENSKNITRKALVTAALGTVMMFSAQKADAQYLRVDSKSPVSTLDKDFSPAVGFRAVYAGTTTYQGFYPDYDISVMFSEGRNERTRAGIELNARYNLSSGSYSKHAGFFAGVKAAYADDFRDFGTPAGDRGKQTHEHRGILAVQGGAFVNLNSFRIEGTAMLDTKGAPQFIVGLNVNMLRGKFAR